jgi:predicted RNA-binding protein YlxR (DUF448 family)
VIERRAGAERSGGAATRHRTCVGCRRTAAPAELVRIAAGPDGSLYVGPGSGRGAWLCLDAPGCFEAAMRRRALARALRRGIEDDEVAPLRATLYGRRTAEGRPR